MAFNKFTVFGALAVVLLMVVVSTDGKPTKELETEDAIATMKHGIHGWLKNMGKKIHEHTAHCKHEMFTWVKKKFGHAMSTSEATDSGNHHKPENEDCNRDGDAKDTAAAAGETEEGNEDVAPVETEEGNGDAAPVETEEGNGDVAPVETGNVDNPFSDDDDDTPPMTSEPVDPVIDVRAGFEK